jgi:hypothetical protein
VTDILERLRAYNPLEIIAGCAQDKLQELQAKSAIPNFG